MGRRLAALAALAALTVGCQPQSTLPGGNVPRRGGSRPSSDWLDGPSGGSAGTTAAPTAGRDPKPPRKDAGRDPNFDAVKESRGALGGVVEDPEGDRKSVV